VILKNLITTHIHKTEFKKHTADSIFCLHHQSASGNAFHQNAVQMHSGNMTEYQPLCSANKMLFALIVELNRLLTMVETEN
jgi:hypothetical protein